MRNLVLTAVVAAIGGALGGALLTVVTRVIVPLVILGLSSCFYTYPSSQPEAYPVLQPLPSVSVVNHGTGKQVLLIKLDTEIAPEAADAFYDYVTGLSEYVDAVVVEIDSTGGYTTSAYLMQAALLLSKAPTHCVVKNMAASGAFLVLQACGHRWVTPNSRLMLHEAKMPPDNTLFGFVNNILAERMVNDDLYHSFCARMLMPEEECYDNYRGRNWWLDAGMAVELGAADDVALSTDTLIDDLLEPM